MTMKKRKALVKVKDKMSKPAEIDPANEAELVKRLSAMSKRHQEENMNEVLRTSREVSALCAPHIAPFLKQLRKSGVDVDSLRSLLEPSGPKQKAAAQREELLQKLSEHRAKILEAMAESAELKNLESQIQTLVSSGKEISLTTDGVLAVLGRKEDEQNV
jgi:hypothetical protein